MVVWAALYLWSFVVLITTEPTGDGFTRGVNKVTNFVGWQGAAGVLAAILWFMGRDYAKGTLEKWASIVPLLCAILLVTMLIAVFLFAQLAG